MVAKCGNVEAETKSTDSLNRGMGVRLAVVADGNLVENSGLDKLLDLWINILARNVEIGNDSRGQITLLWLLESRTATSYAEIKLAMQRAE